MPKLPLNKQPAPVAPKLRQLIIQWNNMYPWDYLWRKRNNVPWGSPIHLQTSFISMKFELSEQQIYTNKRNSLENERRAKPLTKQQREMLLKPALQNITTQQLTDDEFEELDLSEFNDSK
jgi:hypothetical protein